VQAHPRSEREVSVGHRATVERQSVVVSSTPDQSMPRARRSLRRYATQEGRPSLQRVNQVRPRPRILAAPGKPPSEVAAASSRRLRPRPRPSSDSALSAPNMGRHHRARNRHRGSSLQSMRTTPLAAAASESAFLRQVGDVDEPAVVRSRSPRTLVASHRLANSLVGRPATDGEALRESDTRLSRGLVMGLPCRDPVFMMCKVPAPPPTAATALDRAGSRTRLQPMRPRAAKRCPRQYSTR